MSTKPVRDSAGVIQNTDELLVDDVVRQSVLCPCCKGHNFTVWSFGWDAHAEHRCAGLKGTGAEERKREFKERFHYLFR
jgi:hypothetical protein